MQEVAAQPNVAVSPVSHNDVQELSPASVMPASALLTPTSPSITQPVVTPVVREQGKEMHIYRIQSPQKVMAAGCSL